MATEAKGQEKNEPEENEPEKTDSGTSGRKKIIIGAIIALVVVLGVLGAYFAFSDTPEDAEDVVTPEPIDPALYISLSPQFVLNYVVDNSLRYIQIDLVIKVRSVLAQSAIENHAPTLRSELINFFGRLDFNGMRLPGNRQLVADEALKVVNDTLSKVDPEIVAEAILFNTFVLQ